MHFNDINLNPNESTLKRKEKKVKHMKLFQNIN